MSNPIPVVSARSIEAGRYLLAAGTNHFVADATVSRGGKGEAVLASELYLSSLVTCGLALVTEAARQRGLDDSLFGAEASYVVDPEDGTRFEKVSIEFVLAEVDDDTADALLKSFTDICPIYNTVARDTRVDVTFRRSSQAN